jgi:hypothetical protein
MCHLRDGILVASCLLLPQRGSISAGEHASTSKSRLDLEHITMRLSISSSLLAAVTLAAAGEASIFSSRGLSATPKWFSGIQKTVAKNSNSQLSERATVVRGGAAPGEETADEAHADTEAEAVVDVQDLYLPGLLDTIITRTNKVCSVVSGLVRVGSNPFPRMSSCSPSCFSFIPLLSTSIGHNSCIGLHHYSLSLQSQRIKAQGWQCRRGDWPSPSRRVRYRPNRQG